LKKEKSDDSHTRFLQQCQALDIQIEKHKAKAVIYLPPTTVDDIHHLGNDADDGWINNEWKDIMDDGLEMPEAPFSFSFQLARISPIPGLDTEKKPRVLPSMIGHEKCANLGLQGLVSKEIALCKGQANDSLQRI
jgi:hypothetical protein